MLRISSAAFAPGITRQMSLSQKDIESSLKELSSGSRVDSGPGRGTDRAIAAQLKSDIKGVEAADRSAQTASSFVQVTEGSLNEQQNILIRMKELAIQASSDILPSFQRDALNYEFQQVSKEFDRIAKTSQFGNAPSLNGDSKTLEFQVGPHAGKDNVIQYDFNLNTTSSHLDLDGLSLGDDEDARDSLETLDEALGAVSMARAQLGSIQNRFDSISSHLQTQSSDLTEAHSRYADSDIASAVIKLKTAQGLQQYQVAALSSLNHQQESVLRLIG